MATVAANETDALGRTGSRLAASPGGPAPVGSALPDVDASRCATALTPARKAVRLARNGRASRSREAAARELRGVALPGQADPDRLITARTEAACRSVACRSTTSRAGLAEAAPSGLALAVPVGREADGLAAT